MVDVVWSWTVLEENEFAALYDTGYYWVVEDKTRSSLPTKFTGEIKTLKNIYVDFAEGPDARPIFIRAYYPKHQIELQLAMQAFWRLTQDKRRKFRELKEMFRAEEAYKHG